MSKVIQSPVKRWPGTVVLSDPLAFPQYMAWQEAVEKAQEIIKIGEATQADLDHALLPGVCACVEQWQLDGAGSFTPENFPATPRRSSAALIAWLVREISALVTEADDLPNA